MKLTLKQKREIVRRFAAGESMASLWEVFITDKNVHHEAPKDGVQQVIRDFLNAKFQLTKGKRK